MTRDREARVVRLEEAAEFGWDHVHLFPPYVSGETVCESLDVPAGDCARVVREVSTDDGVMSLAFTLRGRVVRLVLHRRWNGDFTPVAVGQRVARADAVFRVVRDDMAVNGKPWPRLVRIDRHIRG